MRCPRCGRYARAQRGAGKEIVSVCTYCGEINLSSYKSIEKTGRSFDYLKMILISATIILASVSALLYLRSNQRNDLIADLEKNLIGLNAQYTKLINDYVILLNNSETLQEYYENTRSNYDELQIMYQDLRQEYSDLQGFQSDRTQENAELMEQISKLNLEKEVIQKELDDTLSSKSMFIDNNSSYPIPPGGNTTILYDIDYAGYIEVNFTSTTDIYIWIGSPVSEDAYYFRFPAFPRTAFNGTFSVPVSNAVFLFIENTDVEASGVVIITIKYTY